MRPMTSNRVEYGERWSLREKASCINRGKIHLEQSTASDHLERSEGALFHANCEAKALRKTYAERMC